MPATSTATTGTPNVSAFVMRIGSHPAVFGLAVVLAVGVLMFFLAVVPLTRALQGGGSASLDDANARLEKARGGYDSESKIIDRVAGISARDRALIAYALPVAEDGPGISVQMNAIAAASGVELSRIDISRPPEAAAAKESAAPAAGLKPVNVALTVRKVDYERLKLFIGNLEDNLRITDLRTMNYSPSSGTLVMELRLYYLSGN